MSTIAAMSVSDSTAHTSQYSRGACAERHFIMTVLLPGPTLARFGLKSGIWLQKRDTSEPVILIVTV